MATKISATHGPWATGSVPQPSAGPPKGQGFWPLLGQWTGMGLRVLPGIQLALDKGEFAREYGDAQYHMRMFEAKQLDENARNRFAAGTRRAQNQRRRGAIMVGNAKAAQAASGGVTTDSGAIRQQAKIEREYNALSASELYQASREAGGMHAQAASKRYEGRTARREGEYMRRAAHMQGFASVLDDASDIYSKWQR